jgi:hypothetical protein
MNEKLCRLYPQLVFKTKRMDAAQCSRSAAAAAAQIHRKMNCIAGDDCPVANYSCGIVVCFYGSFLNHFVTPSFCLIVHSILIKCITQNEI